MSVTLGSPASSIRTPSPEGNWNQCCRICEDITICQNHFGAISCKSCRAFFRRAVTAGSRFTCRSSGACTLRKKVKCVQQVQAAYKHLPSGPSTVPESELLGSRGWIVAIRDQLLAGTTYTAPGGQEATQDGIIEVFFKGAIVLYEYLNRLDPSFYSALRDDVTALSLAQAAFSGWHLFESALATLQNTGRNHRRFYLVHGHYVDYTETALVNFCARQPKMRDAAAVGRYYFEKMEAYMTFVATLKKVEPDNVELLTLWQLFFAQNHPDFFKSLATRQQFVNRLLVNLHGHYAATYQKFATRMARISTLLYQFRAMRQAIDEVDVFIKLNSRPTLNNEPTCWHHRFVLTCPDYANCTLIQNVCRFSSLLRCQQKPHPVSVNGVDNLVYTVEVKVGTQRFNLTLDSNAQGAILFAKSFTWTNHSCSAGDAKRNLFDSSISKSFQAGYSAEWALYRYPYIGVECHQSVGWGEGVQGIWAYDTFSFETFNVSMLPFVLANHTDIPLNPLWSSDGILPLGLGVDLTLPQILQTVGGRRQISLWLNGVPKSGSGGAAKGGQITFGGVDTAYCSSNWTKIQNADVEDWSIAIAGVQIGSKTVRPSAASSLAKIAVASPFFEVPNAYFRKIVGALNGEYNFELDQYTVDCGKVASLPHINISIGAGFPFTYAVPPTDFVAQLTTKSGPKCALLIVQSDQDEWAIGTQFLPKRCILFDYEDRAVSFADPLKKN